MRRIRVTDSQFLSLFELCLEAEERCLRQTTEALLNGQGDRAAFNAQMRDKYSLLKNRLFDAMSNPESNGLSLTQIQEQIKALGMPPTKPEAADSRN
jgi:hypothetical protein